MMRRRPRPPVGWIVTASVLGYYVLRAALGAGIITALTVVALHPSGAVWIPLFITLTGMLGLLDLRHNAPQWFAWLRGRLPQRPESN